MLLSWKKPEIMPDYSNPLRLGAARVPGAVDMPCPGSGLTSQAFLP
jgi:hypothetical protein